MGAPAVTMNNVYMPDQGDLTGELAKYKLINPTVQVYYAVPGTLRQIFDSCGKGSKTDPPTVASVIQVPEVPAGSTGLFSNYATVASTLQQSYEGLQAADVQIASIAQKSADASAECQADINTAIDLLNQYAPTVSTDPSMSQDEYTWDYVNTTITKAQNLLDQTYKNQQDIANGASGPTSAAQDQISAAEAKQKAADQQAYDDLQNKYDAATAAVSGPSEAASGSTDYSDLFDGASGSGITDGASGSDDLGDDLADDTGSTGSSDIADQLQNAIDSLQNSADQNSGVSADDTGSSMLDSMLPMMMESQMDRGNNDSDLNDRRNQVDPDNTIQPTPPQVAQSPGAAQAAQPAAPAPAATPSNSSSSQPTLGPSGPAPSSDGSVTYTFDDGRTQKVSAVVAQALDAARANTDGTDAQAAYSKTSSKWSDSKHIGDAVDPYQLMTGDVATWANRTAIVVVFPPDQSSSAGSMEVMVQGKLQPFTPDMSDKQGDFGQFTGFSHPHGIELPTSAAAPGGAVPVTADHSAAAAPAVAAPTG